ncbi:hypothetical protein [Marinomonas atlantica]|uniref:hypothetical protein n=1 Tax=Marinomonas atlantica TaxID=1806668 RepID=UPI00083390F7|nr:hypothetical protein [Marinomonas atlantica]
MNLAEEIAQWQQTGNPAHATDILYRLAKVLDSSKRSSIERIQDVTVGHGSGADIESGILWVVVYSHSALYEQVAELQRQLEAIA